MSRIYEIEHRLLIPNWRDFKRTVLIGELGSNTKPKDINIDNAQIKSDWQNGKNIGVAADLIGASFISNDLASEELNDAIKFVENNVNDASSPLISLINKIKCEQNPSIEDQKTILENNIGSINEFNSLASIELFNKLIASTKGLTKSYNLNSIFWVELARLYTIKNQISKAEKCFLVALNLAPNNRFVLRSAVRFFIHSHDAEKALFYLRKSQSIKSDPWLISAHIASSNLLGRHSIFIKNGINLISSKNHSSFDLTELSSSIGTLEFENGSFKKAKPFIDLSRVAPNDNSLAQLEWLSKKESKFQFQPNLSERVVNPFEAMAYENFQKGRFMEAFYSCINWYLDFPYSKRPLIFGSYIASLNGDFNASIILCTVGLRLDKSEIGFINNIIYAYCLSNNLLPAEKYLNQLNYSEVQQLSSEERIMLQATVGLYNMRNGNYEEGKALYKFSMENSRSIKSDFYYNLGLINFTRELCLINDSEFESYYELFKKIESTDQDIVLQKSMTSKVIKDELEKYL